MQALEERVAFLEEVRRLPAQMMRQTGAVSGRTAPDFLARFSGIFGDDPTFAEATRLGRAWREGNTAAEVSGGPIRPLASVPCTGSAGLLKGDCLPSQT